MRTYRFDTQTLKTLAKHNRRIYWAWQLTDEFEHFWTFKATWAAERYLKRWNKSALLSRLEPMRNFVKTLRKHQTAFIAFINTGVTVREDSPLRIPDIAIKEYVLTGYWPAPV